MTRLSPHFEVFLDLPKNCKSAQHDLASKETFILNHLTFQSKSSFTTKNNQKEFHTGGKEVRKVPKKKCHATYCLNVPLETQS